MICANGLESFSKRTRETCIQSCEEMSSVLIVLVKADYETTYCDGDLCACSCFPRLFGNGTCPQESSPYYDLYNIDKGNF